MLARLAAARAPLGPGAIASSPTRLGRTRARTTHLPQRRPLRAGRLQRQPRVMAFSSRDRDDDADVKDAHAPSEGLEAGSVRSLNPEPLHDRTMNVTSCVSLPLNPATCTRNP